MGLIPFNLIHVGTGVTLNSATNIGLQPVHVIIAFFLGILSLFPVVVMKLAEMKQGKTKV